MSGGWGMGCGDSRRSREEAFLRVPRVVWRSSLTVTPYFSPFLLQPGFCAPKEFQTIIERLGTRIVRECFPQPPA